MSLAPALPLVKRLLEAAGYRVHVRPEALVAVRAEDHRAVLVDRRRRPPAELEHLFPLETVRRTLLYSEEPGPAVRADAAGRGIEVLDPSTLGPALGELLLPSPRAGAERPDGGSGEDPLDAPFPVILSEARTVVPRIDRTEAEELAGLHGARYTLRLVPHYVAAYRVRTLASGGSSGPIVHRLVAVNATTRSTEIWEEGERELAGPPDGSVQRLAPQFGDAVASSLALEAVRRHHAGRIDHTEQHAGALVIESRRVFPAPGDVRVGPLALLYVPFWYAEGSAGRVVLDAVSGRRASGLEPDEGRFAPR